MTHHASYSVPMDHMDVVLVEDSKPMQGILRSIIASLRPRRVRTFDRADQAMEAMLHEPPTLIISDWRMEPMSGATFLRTLRDKRMAPLCFVPVIVVTAHATRPVVERAMSSGAHFVLVKPLSPALLLDRVQRVCDDKRHFVLDREGAAYEIEGIRDVLAAQQARTEALLRAREFHEAALRNAGEHPDDSLSGSAAGQAAAPSAPVARKAGAKARQFLAPAGHFAAPRSAG